MIFKEELQSDLTFFQEAYNKLSDESLFVFYDENTNLQRIQDLKKLEEKILDKLEGSRKIKFKNLQLASHLIKFIQEQKTNMEWSDSEIPF